MEPKPVEEESEEPETPTTPTKASEDIPSAPPERKTNFQKVVVTEVSSCVMFWAQQVEQGEIFFYTYSPTLLFKPEIWNQF